MLTRETMRTAKVGFTAHLKMQGGGGWHQTYADIPRLTVFARGGVKTWSVDGKLVRDLDAALDVLNGVKTLEEAAWQEIPPEAHRPGKVSIEAQLAEVDYELEQRKTVYARIAASTPSRRGELDLHVERLKAIRGTLVWLQKNEAAIRQRMSY